MIRPHKNQDDSSNLHILIVIGKEQSESEMFDVVRGISSSLDSMESAGKKIQAPLLFVDGFNHDARELHEIPEAMAVLKRALNVGFASVLHCSTMLDPPLGNRESRMWAFGAFELWAIATGRLKIKNNRAEIHGALVKKFFEEVLPRENQRLQNRIARWRRENKGGSSC